MTNNTAAGRRMPAEWESDGAVLLSWPHKDTDWAYMLDEVTRCYCALTKAIIETGQTPVIIAPDTTVARQALGDEAAAKSLFIDMPTNDTWTRDFGPITVYENNTPLLVDFKFNGWGLKFASDKDNLVTMRLCQRHLFTAARENRLSFVLEGGSIESDGKGTLLTTSECLLSPNRNGGMSKDAIEAALKEALGVNHVLWLDHGALAGDDTDSHIDTLVRIAPDDTLIYTGCQNPEDEHYDCLKRMEEQLTMFRTPDGKPYNLVWLPLPDPIYDADGERLPATYANFLVTPKAVLMPVYAQAQNDRLAAMILHTVFEREVITVDCRPLIAQHGSLHCATMQLSSDTLCI